jgi:hypothetical protein
MAMSTNHMVTLKTTEKVYRKDFPLFDRSLGGAVRPVCLLVSIEIWEPAKKNIYIILYICTYIYMGNSRLLDSCIRNPQLIYTENG